MPGRPPKPTKLHVLKGTDKTGRMSSRGDEPTVNGKIGAAPEWLGDWGKKEWHRVASEVVYGKLLRANHRPSFEHYCFLYNEFVGDATGVKNMSASHRQTFHSLCMQFGFTPASQAKVSMPTEIKKDEWDELAMSG